MIIPNGSGGMIILPDAPQPEEKCPKCHKSEDLVTACGHCGYVYPDEEETPFPWMGFFILLFILWIIVTVLCWLINLAFHPNDTLVSFFVGQYHFIINALKHIF